MTLPPFVLRIHPQDNVGVALQDLKKGERSTEIIALDPVSAGHKIALQPIRADDAIIKYGYVIGTATTEIRPGEHVHVHNMASVLKGKLEQRRFENSSQAIASSGRRPQALSTATFDGFRRPNGAIGIRNEIWILNTVGCVNHVATRIAQKAAEQLVYEGSAIEGIYTFNHPFGCSQLGGDLVYTQRLLSGLAKHPNAAAVMVLGLGCENNQLKQFMEYVDLSGGARVRAFNAQDVEDELETGVRLVHELAEYAGQFTREPIPVGELVLGMKCGGSDGLSGITGNPLIGRIADKLAAAGGTSVLSEVPEMFGAENVLLQRAVDAGISDATVQLVNAFREYFHRHGERIDENPSPGNKDGGITTLAEKSLGCIQKGGTFPVKQVLDYGQQASPGLGGIALLNGPGNDGVSGSALSAAGAHMLLFSTGRGTPMGFPVPTIKISTNTPIAHRKAGWIDFNAGLLAEGTATMDALADELYRLVLEVASGRIRTRTELNGFREISIWKDGVTL
jgi:altronate hydrolase